MCFCWSRLRIGRQLDTQRHTKWIIFCVAHRCHSFHYSSPCSSTVSLKSDSPQRRLYPSFTVYCLRRSNNQYQPSSSLWLLSGIDKMSCLSLGLNVLPIFYTSQLLVCVKSKSKTKMLVFPASSAKVTFPFSTHGNQLVTQILTLLPSLIPNWHPCCNKDWAP